MAAKSSRPRQKKVTPQEIGLALRSMGAQAVLFHVQVAEALGLNATDLRCLVIAGDAPVTAGRLAELTGLTTGAITGVIDRLERGRFVRRREDPRDRRRVVIEATHERDADVHRLFAPLGPGMHAVLSRFGERELQALFDFSQRAAAVFREGTAKLSGLLAAEAAAAGPDEAGATSTAAPSRRSRRAR
jgi:DNA-binding MarR family transcriptional regulator